jgi:hypothetical protein
MHAMQNNISINPKERQSVIPISLHAATPFTDTAAANAK